MPSQPVSRILSRELPLDGSALIVSITLPSGHFAAKVVSLGVCVGQQFSDEGNEVDPAPVLGDRNDPLAGLWFDRDEQTGRAVAHVFLVHLGSSARVYWQWRAAL